MKRSVYDTLHALRHTLLLRDHSLTTRLLLLFALLIVIPICVVGLFTYYQSARIMERDARDYNYRIIEQVKTYVDDYLRNFEITTLKIVNHPDTISFLRMKSADEVEESGIKRSLANVLRNTLFSQSDLTNATLVLDHIDVIDAAAFMTNGPRAAFREKNGTIRYRGRAAQASSAVRSIGTDERFRSFPSSNELSIRIRSTRSEC